MNFTHCMSCRHCDETEVFDAAGSCPVCGHLFFEQGVACSACAFPEQASLFDTLGRCVECSRIDRLCRNSPIEDCTQDYCDC